MLSQLTTTLKFQIFLSKLISLGQTHSLLLLSKHGQRQAFINQYHHQTLDISSENQLLEATYFFMQTNKELTSSLTCLFFLAQRI